MSSSIFFSRSLPVSWARTSESSFCEVRSCCWICWKICERKRAGKSRSREDELEEDEVDDGRGVGVRTDPLDGLVVQGGHAGKERARAGSELGPGVDVCVLGGRGRCKVSLS